MTTVSKIIKNHYTILLFMAIAVLGFYSYSIFKIPEGVSTKGDSNELISLIGLVTAIVSMFTALFGLIQKIVELRSGDSK